VGRVVDAWGVKGWIKVEPYAADPQALFSCRQWWARLPGATASTAGSPTLLLRVAEAREHGDVVVARCHDITDRAAAEALRGALIHVPRASFPTPDDDEYYWVDLIGCQVVNRQGLVLGVVQGLLETGPTCVLRIGAEPEILIPFVSAYVDAVRLDDRAIVVDWQAGD
jgi:16S rRNA processing protein RimM